MLTTLIKRNGEEQDFIPRKANSWGIWASKTLGNRVDWSDIILGAMRDTKDRSTTQEFQQNLITRCILKGSWPYNLMAGRLFVPVWRKEIFGTVEVPTIQQTHRSLQALGLMRHMDYSDAEYQELEEYIDHEKDFGYSKFQLDYIRHKYTLRDHTNKNKEYETPQLVYMRLAMAIEESNTDKKMRMYHIKNFYDVFSDNLVNIPTPYMVSLGTPRYGLASCCVFKANDAGNSITIHDYIASMMTQSSAGLGSFLGVRSAGNPVRGGAIIHNGKAPYWSATAKVSKASKQLARAGALTGYFNCFDPEASFLAGIQNFKTPDDSRNRDMHFAIQYNAFFIDKAVKAEKVFTFNVYTCKELFDAFYNGDAESFAKLYDKYEQDESFEKNYISARELLVKASGKEAYEVGTVYEWFADEANRHTPFIDVIYSSNLCVAPETQILTDKGYVTIKDQAGQTVNVWNGQEWSEVEVVKTGENQELMSVYVSDGKKLEATPYHKWYVQVGYGDGPANVVEKRTHELEPGNRLIKFDFPIIQGEKELDKAWINGFYTGDGCSLSQEKKQRVYLYGQKRSLLNHFVGMEGISIHDNQERIFGHYKDLQDKYFVPDASYSLASRLEWLAGWLDADGNVCRNGTNESLVGSSIDRDFLLRVQAMLETMGVTAKIRLMRKAGFRSMPVNDGTGGTKEYFCQNVFRLLISSGHSQKLLDLGLKPRRLVIAKRETQREAIQFVIVENVIKTNRFDDTYCFTEHKRHMGVFNGILTGQCTEIDLPTDGYEDIRDLYLEEDHGRGEVALCNIGGIVTANTYNLDGTINDEKYAKAAYYVLRMIDRGIHISDYVLPHVGFTAKQRMNAGVGMIGVATTMARAKQKYDTQEGRNFANEMGESHYWHLLNASLELSKEFGNAPWMHKTKWPQGWLPIDTYNKNVDTLVTSGNKRDWEAKRQEIIANGGHRFSVLVAHMPSESSSKSSGVPNAYYPVRGVKIKKSDDASIIDWVAMDSDLLEKDYQVAWSIDMIDQVKYGAVLQKWADQGLSADYYEDRTVNADLKVAKIVQAVAARSKYGHKGRYYMNSLTSDNQDDFVGYKSQARNSENKEPAKQAAKPLKASQVTASTQDDVQVLNVAPAAPQVISEPVKDHTTKLDHSLLSAKLGIDLGLASDDDMSVKLDESGYRSGDVCAVAGPGEVAGGCTL